MQLATIFQKFFKKGDEKIASTDALQTVRNWYNDRYQDTLIQRNVLFVALILALILVLMCVVAIRYIKNEHAIEPFVIEIEEKTGVPTIVEPLTVQAFVANETVKRYFVWQYIKAREEYLDVTFNQDAQKVRLFSLPKIFNSYRRISGRGNPESPVNKYAAHSTINIKLKSMIFTESKVAQVRISVRSKGSISKLLDKIILIKFDFLNLELNSEERFINPLGFIVTFYKIEDESVKSRNF